MLKSFLLITLRNILHNKGSAWLNILCLTLGVATCLFIFNYITYEFSFDRQFDEERRVFRLERVVSGKNSESYFDAFSTIAAGPYLQEQKEIAQFARLVPFSEEGVAHFRYQPSDTVEQRVYLESVYYADPSITGLFSIDWLQGDSSMVLLKPNSVVLSLPSAQRIFPEEMKNGISVLGREFKSNRPGLFSKSYTVTGIFSDLPSNTHLKFDALVATPISDLHESSHTYTYVSIAANAAPSRAIADVAKEASFFLRPVQEIHLSPFVSNNPEPGTSKELLLFLAFIGMIVMLLAISNYTNTTILNSFDRAKEIGIRKLVGITPRQLISTFMGEAFLVICIAGLLAIVFFRLGINLALIYGKAAQTSAIINPIDYQSIIEQNLALNGVFLASLLLISTLLSSIYPALYFNSLNPVALLRGKLQLASSRLAGGASRVVRSLLIFQITISVLFLSGVYIVFAQLRHMEEHDRQPFELNVKGVFPGSSMASPLFSRNVFDRIDELVRRGHIRQVAFSNLYEGQIKTTGEVAIIGLNGQLPDTLAGNALFVTDYSYWSEPDDSFAAGRNFSKSFGKDERKIIMNTAAMDRLGIEVADSLLQKELRTDAGRFEIIGVVAESSTQPRLYVTGFAYRSFLDLTLQYPGKAGESLQGFLGSVEIALSSPLPFISLLSRKYESQRMVEDSILTMFVFFTLMAILIANIGMFGLSSFITQKRGREIGIRKILGASTLNALWVLVFDFLKLALLGAAISTPVVLWGGNLWLDDYGSRISISPGMVLLPVMVILLISLMVVVEKCWKAAVTSPLKALDMG